jgi:acetaldehyde dehydrogenase/alcohol dehydrogenase
MQSTIDRYLEKSRRASLEFASFGQRRVDEIVSGITQIGMKYSEKFAKMAVYETGMGKWEDKLQKNILATKYVYDDIKNLKTVGVISNDRRRQIMEIAHPLGPILGIIPVTNPTSTLMFKVLIALKTRNPIILSFPKRAKRVCTHLARILQSEARRLGSPKDAIQWVSEDDRDIVTSIMRDERLALILATGGKNLVNTAYSSGTPALGVGPANVPVFIDESADIEFAINQIMISKTFDNGTICASEQAIIIEKKSIDRAIQILEKLGAYVLKDSEISALESVVYNLEKGKMSSEIVGKSAEYIAKLAKLDIQGTPSLLVARQNNVGESYPLSSEILAPVIALYEAQDFEHALELCKKINFHGGNGHTASIFSNSEERILRYSMELDVSRIIVNSPSAHGAVGGLCNNLSPSLTLGCGSSGKTSTTDNITAKHLLNIQRVAKPRIKYEVSA